ncbi:MAG: glycosyltransferase [Acidobacteriaceae bacterium]|nr:glycosyltransferase [Acidobacteriaceae bacterium]
MVILTNLEDFPASWRAANGLAGTSRRVRSARDTLRFYAENREAAAMINCDPAFTYRLAARCLLHRRKLPIVAVDLVLRKPKTFRSRLFQPFRRVLLKRVNYFIHYFKDLSGYQSTFGIGPDRSSFVPFKANLFSVLPQDLSEGSYVTCLGRTLRDFDTFFAAMETLPFEGAISQPDFKAMKAHGSRFSRPLEKLPRNVRILEDNGSRQGMADALKASKIVVLPILKESIAASGSSTCLNAMLFNRCVIGTEGPGFSDVFNKGELVCVPPEDPKQLARAIQEIWSNDDRRRKVASAGHQYALEAGDLRALFQRLIDSVADWYLSTQHV